jgi:hypothetical protein
MIDAVGTGEHWGSVSVQAGAAQSGGGARMSDETCLFWGAGWPNSGCDRRKVVGERDMHDAAGVRYQAAGAAG